MSDNDYPNIGRLLEAMSSHGIYSTDIVRDQFPAYGFTYDEATGTLEYEGVTRQLMGRTVAEMQDTLDSDPKGGILDHSAAQTDLLVDALQLSEIVYRLVVGPVAPSNMFHGRGRGHKANIEAIIQRLELD